MRYKGVVEEVDAFFEVSVDQLFLVELVCGETGRACLFDLEGSFGHFFNLRRKSFHFDY